MDFPEKLHQRIQTHCRGVPSTTQTQGFTDNMMHFLFPLHDNKNIKVDQLRAEWKRLQCLFDDLLSSLDPFLPDSPDALKERFFDAIPDIHAHLLEEADFFVRCDPAANCSEEVILCYPGFYAIAVYRLAHQLYLMKIPILPRAMAEYAHSRTGIDINPGADIGRYFYIDHGTGIVIGETTKIGNNVKLYQGVTLGALYVERDLRHTKRHPTIEDDVIIYAGSTILGGNTVIGRNTTVGGNVWLTESVAPNSVVYHKAEVVIRDQNNQ